MAPSRYTSVAIALHWAIAAATTGLLALGLVMTGAGLTALHRFQLYQLHKSLGIGVLILSAMRIAWRLSHRPPPLAATTPAAERRAAHAAHRVLHALLLAMPLTGWAVASASRYDIPTVLFGVVPWPHLPIPPTSKATVEAAAKTLHGYGAWFLIALVALHAGAALRHHLVHRDDTLRRMLPLFLAGRSRPMQ